MSGSPTRSTAGQQLPQSCPRVVEKFPQEAEHRPKLADLGHDSAGAGRIWHHVRQVSPTLVELGRFGRRINRPKLAKFDCILAECGPHQKKSDPNRSMLVEVGPILGSQGNVSTILGSPLGDIAHPKRIARTERHRVSGAHARCRAILRAGDGFGPLPRRRDSRTDASRGAVSHSRWRCRPLRAEHLRKHGWQPTPVFYKLAPSRPTLCLAYALTRLPLQRIAPTEQRPTVESGLRAT